MRSEVEIIKKVFGQRAYSIPVSSIKGVTGNALAAGGPFQVIACALAIRDQLLPPTANYEVADPACDLDFVPNRARKVKLNSALVNVRGSGWQREHHGPKSNCCVMSGTTVPTLAAIALQLVLGLAVFQANPKRRLNQCFLLLSVVIVAWLGIASFRVDGHQRDCG